MQFSAVPDQYFIVYNLFFWQISAAYSINLQNHRLNNFTLNISFENLSSIRFYWV